MNEEEWKKAIRLSKGKLIEWLNEMYQDEKILKEIIMKYEKTYCVGSEYISREYYNPLTLENEIKSATLIKAKDFSYYRSW